MNPRLVGCSFIHRGRSLDEGLRTVAELGFGAVDAGIGGLHGHLSPLEAAREPGRQAEQVRRAAERHGLALHECFTLNFGPPINTPDSALREETRRNFEGLARFAALAGFRSILLLPGPVHEGHSPQRSLDLAVEAFAPLAELAASRGVELHAEADCNSCAQTPAAAAELCERVPGLRLTLDYSHFVFRGHAQAGIARLHRFAGHVHLRQAAPGRIVETVAKGTIDYRAVLRDLEQCGYEGSFAIEYLACAEADACGAEVLEETRKMALEIERLLGERKPAKIGAHA